MIFFSKITFLLCILTSFFLFAETEKKNDEPPADPPLGIQIITNGAYLQVLDKITGNMSTIVAKIDEIIKFGTIRIRLKYCQKNAPEDVPESKAFVEVWEEKLGESQTILFSNWMFSSSPSLSTLEHPVYGLWVKECADISEIQKQ